MSARSTAYQMARMAYRIPRLPSVAAALPLATGIACTWAGNPAPIALTVAAVAAAAAIRDRRSHRALSYAWAAGITLLAMAGAGAYWNITTGQIAAWSITVGAVLQSAVLLWWLFWHVGPAHSSHARERRAQELANRAGGFATLLDVAEHAGPRALRLRATTLRPSTRALTWWQRRRLDPWSLGVLLASNGLGLPGQRLWSPNEDCTMEIAGPRIGKTSLQIEWGKRAPGALVTTSTRLDLAEGVHAVRTQRGPVYVFDPTGAVRPGAPVTPIKWRVLSGCENFATAQRRAADMIPESESADRDHWVTQGRAIFALLLHAAEVTGGGMAAVRRWAMGSETIRDQVVDALQQCGAGAGPLIADWLNYCITGDRTRTSIGNAMENAAAWVADDMARAIGNADPHDPGLLDIPTMIAGGHTLHMIGRQQGATRVAPLIAALAGEIAHQARTMATHAPGGRLDPPLTMLLDEAATACPMDLADLTSDMGGRAVTMHIAVQSAAQMEKTWGRAAAKALMTNCTTLIYGGSGDADHMEDVSKLAGHILAQVDEDDRRLVPVLEPARIRELPKGHVVVFPRGLRPFIGRTPSCLNQRRSWRHPFRPVSRPIPLGWETSTAQQVAPTRQRPTVPAQVPAHVDTAELEAIVGDMLPGGDQ